MLYSNKFYIKHTKSSNYRKSYNNNRNNEGKMHKVMKEVAEGSA